MIAYRKEDRKPMTLAMWCSKCGTELGTTNAEPLAHPVIELARQVRAAQKKYFKTRDRNDLVACKQLESQLDSALANG